MVEAMDFLFTLLIPIKKPAETDLRSCELYLDTYLTGQLKRKLVHILPCKRLANQNTFQGLP